ncbi:MAG: FCSD flavin-binding domain-containing protein [Thiomargarita sp.]|nr:FCSD flavin-binding domain-containing protein [Thiomargarita sp.]
MNPFSRRQFIKFAGAVGALSSLSACQFGEEKVIEGRVVIVGGGFGGATCAKYIRRFNPNIEVTLIERDAKFITCPFSNMVLAGLYGIDWITHEYTALRDKYSVKIIQDTVIDIEPIAKKVLLKGGKSVHYDRLVMSPGIDFQWDAIEGYTESISHQIPHAWKAGAQTLLLRDQLQAMKDGGVVIIAPPRNPFRCPPGPYERAGLIAHYLKQHKPKSKILILDAKDTFSKQALFTQGWADLYPGMIEWVEGSFGGHITGVDAKTNTLYNSDKEAYKGDVINIIPPQKAGLIAHKVGLVNEDGWCPINQRTFESQKHADIHVIGDACIGSKMPKSGFAANSQAKVCAAAIVTSLDGTEMPEPSYVNTCYSLIGPDYGISVAAVYRFTEQGIMKIKASGGVSPQNAHADFRRKEAHYAIGWYMSITNDIFDSFS